MTEANKNKLPKREDIDQAYKWKLEDIYAEDHIWEEDLKRVKQLSEEIVKYKGHLGESSDKLLQCLSLCDELLSLNDKVFVYARMRRDENNANPVYQAFTDKVMALSTEVYAAVSFITPEIISIGENILKDFIDKNPGLKIYKQAIDGILRQKQHVLPEKEEELLALFSEVAHAPADIFSMYNNADIKFPEITDEDGNKIELTKGRYIKFLESKDRRVREDAFNTLYDTYSKQKNTLATTLVSNVKKNKLFASIRKYGSSLEASLDSDNIAVDVYDKLIETVNNNLNLMHRYLKLRKRALKLDELHMYDLYVPIVEEPKRTIPYEEALDTVTKGLAPLGKEYLDNLENAFGAGWIDVYENQGKTSGAYSWGAYLTHPYVLLNYQGTINDVFTIAHEMGHALHSFYTNKKQPYVYSEYKIFVAEVASTVNESLLMKYLLENARSKGEKAYLLNMNLESFRGTLFRQVMFAEFEKIIHAKAEAGESLTTEDLCAIYYDLNRKYFGDEVVIDKAIEMEWARIPHFYTSFYVYKYATGFSAAASLSRQILNEGNNAVARYIDFLSSGSSDYPLELLKKAGVDLSTPKPVEDAMKLFEKSLNELEELI